MHAYGHIQLVQCNKGPGTYAHSRSCGDLLVIVETLLMPKHIRSKIANNVQLCAKRSQKAQEGPWRPDS